MLLRRWYNIMIWVCFLTQIFNTEAHEGHTHDSHKHGESLHGQRVHADEHYKDGVHNPEYDHQAILGSVQEAEEFDHLPPEEAKRKLRGLAKRMDRNSDGYVDEEELTIWIEENLKSLDREELEARFKEIDADKDGNLTWNEFRLEAFGHDMLTDAHITDPDDIKLMIEDKRSWTAADLDKDGNLTKHEFSAFQHPEAYEHMFEVLYFKTLEEKDKNNDTFIDVQEFVGDLTGKDEEYFLAEKDRFSVEFDANNDTKLDREEIRHWLVPSVRQQAQDEMKHLFENSDKDKDEKLSIEEIVNSHELYVGSEATTYGDQLHKVKPHEEL